jgi:hypothetical protein
VTLAGIITYYYLVGSPLRCGGTYNPSTTPWIAMDIDAGHAVCGDRVAVTVDGISKSLIVRDSGNLSRYCVRDGDKCVQIIGDVPKHAAWWEGVSVMGVIVNETMGTREMENSCPPGG